MTKFNTAFFLAATASASGAETLGVCMNYGDVTSINCKGTPKPDSDELFSRTDDKVSQDPYGMQLDCYNAAKQNKFFVGTDETLRWRYVAIGHYDGKVQCKMYTKMTEKKSDRVTVNPMKCDPELEKGPTVGGGFNGGRSWAITTFAECEQAKNTRMCKQDGPDGGCEWATLADAAHALVHSSKKSKAVIV
jgi:hypothetical protein